MDEKIVCPFLPCREAEVRRYQSRPGGPLDLQIIRTHNVQHSSGEWDRACPASGKALPLTPRDLIILEGEVKSFVMWRAERAQREQNRVVPLRPQAPQRTEHSLTPHPTGDRQWFLTGPERKARGMASIEEVKAHIGQANLALAEGQQLAQQASGKFAEAQAVLGGIKQETMQELGLIAATEAMKSCDDASTYANAAIELNAQYGANL